ncbi:MAG: hypothetical protein Alpg2KO_31390 [Alphaproteobacteria bacterium]
MATRKGVDEDASTGKDDGGKPGRGSRFKKRADTMLGGESIRAGRDAGKQAFDRAFADERSARSETFAQARRRMGVDPEQIAAAGNSFRLEAMIYLAISLFLLVSGLLGPIIGIGYTSGFVAFAVICVGVALGSMGLRAAFRNWQIRNGRLGGFEVYLYSPAEWLPRKVSAEMFRSRDVAAVRTEQSGVSRR